MVFPYLLISSCVNAPLSISLSLSLSLHSPDILAQGCETSSDVSTDIQKLIPDQEGLGERSESKEAGYVLSCPTDPGPEQQTHQSRPSQRIQGEPPELECTTQGWAFLSFVFPFFFFSHTDDVVTLNDLTRW